MNTSRITTIFLILIQASVTVSFLIAREKLSRLEIQLASISAANALLSKQTSQQAEHIGIIQNRLDAVAGSSKNQFETTLYSLRLLDDRLFSIKADPAIARVPVTKYGMELQRNAIVEKGRVELEKYNRSSEGVH